VRTRAAAQLAGHQRTANYGSAELNLLAHGAISPSDAEKPFFLDARIAAAKTASLPQRISLLREVIAEAPHNGPAHIQLVNAAISAKDAHLAISAAKPLLDANVLTAVTYGQDQIPEQNQPTETEENLSGNRDFGQIYRAPQAFHALPRAERISILSGLAEAWQQIGEPQSALPLWQQARRLEQDSGRRKILASTIAKLRSELARRSMNAARAPQIHSALDQNHLVQPRLQAAQEGSEP
jgi:tetratricopeptide (TPR) repeat protein